MPSAEAAPSLTAAIARTPDPVPTSITRAAVERNPLEQIQRHRVRVDAWCPVPNPIEAWMRIRTSGAGRGGLRVKHERPCRLGAFVPRPGSAPPARGVLTVILPTVIGGRPAWLRSAQFSSGTSSSTGVHVSRRRQGACGAPRRGRGFRQRLAKRKSECRPRARRRRAAAYRRDRRGA